MGQHDARCGPNVHLDAEVVHLNLLPENELRDHVAALVARRRHAKARIL